MWPNLFIVGAQKAGTTSLYNYLNEIPGVFMSPLKEPHYFTHENAKTSLRIPITNEKDYLNLFKNVKDEKIIGEASPTYLSDPNAPRLIHEKTPQAKIIIMLRNPIERFYSSYLMLVLNGITKLPFHENLQQSFLDSAKKNFGLVDPKRGLYYDSIIRYKETFGEQNLKIIIFEELIKKPKEIFKNILKFINIDYDLQNFEFPAHNQFAVSRNKFFQQIILKPKIRTIAKKLLSPKDRVYLREKIAYKKGTKPKMPNEDRQFLKNFYVEDVNKVKKLLNRELPWPDFQN